MRPIKNSHSNGSMHQCIESQGLYICSISISLRNTPHPNRPAQLNSPTFATATLTQATQLVCIASHKQPRARPIKR